MRRDELRALVEQEKRLHTQMLQLDETARNEKRSFTAEEQEQFDKLCVDFESTRETRTRAERLWVQERDVEKTMATPIEKRIGDAGDAPLRSWSGRSSATAAGATRTSRSTAPRSGTTSARATSPTSTSRSIAR
jgi:hypothetical protein